MLAEPKLHFPLGFDDKIAGDLETKGFCHYAIVEMPHGGLVRVGFYDITVINQDLSEAVEKGNPFVAYPGMIILPKVTIENMKHAVNELYKTDFFEDLMALAKPDLELGKSMNGEES